MSDARRALPAIGVLLARQGVQALGERAPRALVTAAVRRAVDDVRAGRAPAPRDDVEWEARIATALRALERPSLRP
ncbi:MAG: L-seryl-tRNA(Sec) selenium transferase, partial [Gemmatimonadota bacterium]